MKYNIIKIFIVGSTSLEKHRSDLADLAHRYNINSIRSNDSIKDIICLYSYEETGSTYQDTYFDIISNEADVVITILEDELGKISYEEAKLARETNIRTKGARPLVFGLLNNQKKRHEISVAGKLMQIDDLRRELLEEDHYFQTYTNKRFREQASILLSHIIEQSHMNGITNKAERITWGNDGFAYLTIETRFKENYKIVADNFEAGVFEKYNKFEEHKVYQNRCDHPVNTTIENEILRFLDDNEGISRYSGEIGLRSFFRNIPFLLAEYYFYYYLLYLYHDKKGISDRIEDPYRAYKLSHLNNGNDNSNFDALLEAFRAMIKAPATQRQDKFLIGCLNMNSIDLSQLEVNVKEFKDSNMPINDCSAFHKFMKSELSNDRNTDNGGSIAHIITDNSGFELMSDILLGTYLLKNTKLTKVIYHIKRLPIFVSDTIMTDVDDAIEVLNHKLDGVTRYNKHVDSEDRQTYFCDSIPDKQLCFEVNDCWHQETLFQDIEPFRNWNTDDSCALIIVKGDLNYRRLVGDFHWECSEPIKDKVAYIEKPLLIIRSLKSNVILNVSNEESYSHNAPDWKISGKYGIIQFVLPDGAK